MANTSRLEEIDIHVPFTHHLDLQQRELIAEDILTNKNLVCWTLHASYPKRIGP